MANSFEKPQRPQYEEPDMESSYEKISTIVENKLDDPLLAQAQHGPLGCGTDEGFNYPSPHNEDAVVIDTEKNAFAVIDGMGGYGKGRRAALILAEELQKGFTNKETFSTIRRGAHERMRTENLGPNGACYIAGRIDGKELTISQAGDVRLIIIGKDGIIRFKTKDECLSPPLNMVVTNSISGKDAGTGGTHSVNIQDGDRIIVASDGIWDNLTCEQAVNLTKGKNIPNAIAAIEKETREKMQQEPGPDSKPDNRSLLIYDIETLLN